jgi:LSD1 subclass zinc finger protein
MPDDIVEGQEPLEESQEAPQEEPQVEPAESASPDNSKPSIKEISCSNCGAPLTYMEGEAVITCEYCGTTTMLAGYDNIVTVESHFLLPPKVGRDEAIGIASGWLKKGFYKSKELPNKVSWRSTDARVLPYWIVRCTGNTRWSGMQKRTRSVGTGKAKTTETYWEPVSGHITEDYTWPVYAREDTSEFWGIRNIEPGMQSVFPDWGKFILRFGGSKRAPNKNLLEGKMDFSIDELKKTNMHEHIVNGQIIQDRAETSARNRIIELHQTKAESKATQVNDIDTTIDVQGVDLVYLPIWELVYSYRGKDYNVLVDASRQEVLSGEAPVGKWAKATIFDIVFFIIAAIFIVFGAMSDGATWPWIGAGIFGGSAIAYTVWTATMKE